MEKTVAATIPWRKPIKHSSVIDLLGELNIGIFEQALGDRAIYEPISTSPPQLVTLPPNDEPSFRIQGGSDKLIYTLLDQLDSESIYLNTQVSPSKDAVNS